MDIRRTIMAICISVIILIGWQQLAVHMGWAPDPALQQQQQQQQQDTAQPTAQTPVQAPTPMAPLPAFQPSPGRDVVVETPLYKAVFYSGGGLLRSFELKKYKDSIGSDSLPLQLISPEAISKAPMGVILDGMASWSDSSWELEGGDLNLAAGQTGKVKFIGEANGTRLVRELTFDADRYSLKENLTIQSEQPRNLRLAFTMSTGKLHADGAGYDLTRIAYDQAGSFTSEDDEKTLLAGLDPTGEFSWASIMSNYFLAAVIPHATSGTLKLKLEDGAYRLAVEKTGIAVAPGQDANFAATYYIGPKDQKMLDAEPGNLGTAIDYGMFSIVARPLIAMLHFFYSYVGNWGVAIIFLTIVIKILLWPLSYKSYKSMEQLKKLQPMMAKLKEKYGDNKEAMNREMMQLYKTYKINPASGCLPILVQLPVFIGLYQGLLGSIELRHAAFIYYLPFTDMLWLADLSVKDPFYITPIVMGLTMFLQQKLTPAAGDPTQQKIMMFMPLIFMVMFINFPSGLVLYWLTNNVISIGQQWWQLRHVK